MKVLKGGMPYVSSHYQDPEETFLKEKLELARKKKEEKEKMKEEYQELKFSEWLEEKQRHELEKLIPPIGQYLGSIHRAGLKDYFLREVFVE